MPVLAFAHTMAQLPIMEFHISRKARDLYQFDGSLFSLSGNVILANFHAARVFAQKMNQKRDLVNFPERAVKPGQINAMGLIDEILHYMVGLYREQINKDVMHRALIQLNKTLGKEEVDKSLRNFLDEFPPVKVYRQEITIETYLNSETANIPNRQIILEEMLLLWLANMNPAFSPFIELFDDTVLKKNTVYLQIISGLRRFFETQPSFGPYNQSLVDMLRSPAVIVPYSLSGQLEYIRTHWKLLLRKYLYRLLKSLDLFKEEEKVTFMGPGLAEVYKYIGLEVELELFSPDRDWMPRLVLMAKNVYVWLDQLSKKYSLSITKLDQIPDEELDMLGQQGFSGLWLIGIWERSPASQKIKQLCGNPEAVPSAYSLFDYTISEDLGGEEAYQSLKNRAWQRGIRLASDMVPNHVGIYSRWMIEHPDWFVSLNYNPFPWYTFNGTNLSHDERVAIYIEDHYYNRTDASVVCKRVDSWTGSEKYVYHGNDGTSMPWNDTAQLNYLNSEVRETMIQTILHVARKFPIIRFDAAMTLTKKHYQRLWFPEPGTGGAIPTRAEFGLTKDEFNKLMPKEFWREVVDRVAAEAPDTLLLAEAFWLLEGYFVRTLGMHRVYNSAFMIMLRDEENAKYRTVMKNTLEFDPEILRRFVNFMNNPDEQTAVEQFEKGDKYFGTCTMMVTMPGLPMFGHGQIEGFEEKYGMEYRRAYKDEKPDTYLIERHKKEIFPLLHKRYLFAGVEHFLLYDFFIASGYVNEDVFAYSNAHGNERSLVVFNNKNNSTQGWVRTSVAYSVKAGQGNARKLVQKSLGEGLGLAKDENLSVVFRDHKTNLEYIRNCREINEKGLYVELNPYNYQVFLDFRELQDNEWRHYANLTAYLNGRGVPDIEKALREMLLQPIHQSFRELVNTHMFQRLMDACKMISEGYIEAIPQELINEMEEKTVHLFEEIKRYTGSTGNVHGIVREIRQTFGINPQSPLLNKEFPSPESKAINEVAEYIHSHLKKNQNLLYVLFGWLFVHKLGKVSFQGVDADNLSRNWIDELLLGRIIADALRESGFDEKATSESMEIIKLTTNYQSWFKTKSDAHALIESLLRDSKAQEFLQVNRHKDILWFSKEAFEQLMWWLLLIAVIKISSDVSQPMPDMAKAITACYDIIKRLLKASKQSGYQVEKLIKIVASEQ